MFNFSSRFFVSKNYCSIICILISVCVTDIVQYSGPVAAQLYKNVRVLGARLFYHRGGSKVTDGSGGVRVSGGERRG